MKPKYDLSFKLKKSVEVMTDDEIKFVFDKFIEHYNKQAVLMGSLLETLETIVTNNGNLTKKVVELEESLKNRKNNI